MVTQANDESSKNANESAKATKVLRTTAKMIDELLPNMIKAIKIWQGHKVSTKKTTSAKDKCKTNKALRTMRKCYMNYCWIWKKNIKILWAHRLITKAQRMQMKAQNQQSTAHNSKNDTWTSAAYKAKVIKILWAHKLITKAQSIPTKNPKATKYCAQQQNWCMNYCRIGKKSWKHCGHAEWYDFSPSDTT